MIVTPPPTPRGVTERPPAPPRSDPADEHQHPTWLDLPGVGRATSCTVGGASSHRPVPMRYVWHHILPQTAGGLTEPGNLVSLCDSCHYAVHALLYWLAQHRGQQYPPAAGAAQGRRHIAADGYHRAVALGTVDKIPNEGSVTG